MLSVLSIFISQICLYVWRYLCVLVGLHTCACEVSVYGCACYCISGWHEIFIHLCSLSLSLNSYDLDCRHFTPTLAVMCMLGIKTQILMLVLLTNIIIFNFSISSHVIYFISRLPNKSSHQYFIGSSVKCSTSSFFTLMSASIAIQYSVNADCFFVCLGFILISLIQDRWELSLYFFTYCIVWWNKVVSYSFESKYL